MRRTFPPPQPPAQPATVPPDAWPWIALGLLLAALSIIAVAGHNQRQAARADCATVCAPYAPWVSGLSCYCDTQRRAQTHGD